MEIPSCRRLSLHCEATSLYSAGSFGAAAQVVILSIVADSVKAMVNKMIFIGLPIVITSTTKDRSKRGIFLGGWLDH